MSNELRDMWNEHRGVLVASGYRKIIGALKRVILVGSGVGARLEMVEERMEIEEVETMSRDHTFGKFY